MEAPGHLVELIYDAVPDASRWPKFLDAFAEAMHVNQTVLSIMYPAYPEVAVTAIGGPGGTEAVHREYREKWQSVDPWVSNRDMTTVGEGQVVPSQELCPDEILEQTEIYREFLGKHGFHYGGGAMLACGPTQYSVHSAVRPKSAGILTPEELALWQSLVPHLMRAVKLQGRLHELQAERESFHAAFEDHPFGLILSNQQGNALRSNAKARALLNRKDGLSLDSENRLTLADVVSKKEFHRVVELAGHPGMLQPRPAARELMVPRSGFRRPLLLTISPLYIGTASQGPSTPTVGIQVIDPELATLPEPSVLQRLFELTSAEAHFCCKLASGLNVKEISQVLDVSENTARTHLKRTLSKTGTRRQAELISLLHRITTQTSSGTPIG